MDGPGESRQTVVFAARRMPWGTRVAVVVGALITLGLAALVVVPMLIVGLVLVLLGAAWLSARSLIARVRGDGRRNVRVVERRRG